jgi:UDP-N-acetylmuramoyl-tripeptide--D-alanyl-D-alanine ligase
MTYMMTLQQVLDWIPDATLCGAGTTMVARVHTDTRTVQSGDLFVALSGDHHNANEFLAEAKTKGVMAVISDSKERLEKAQIPGLVVQDTRKALGQLARGWRLQFKLPLITVTGSNGKTTVTQMIASILRVYRPQTMLATQGNFNNDVGVPLTLLRLNASHQVAVIELGMNHPGEIAWLAEIAQPTVALVNNAQREHLEFMSSVEAVARENGSVIASLPSAGVAIFPYDDEFAPLWHGIAANRPKLTFAVIPRHPNGERWKVAGKSADIVCERPDWVQGAWQVRVETPTGELAFSLRSPGLHNVKNALAAVACTMAVGVPLADIAQGLQSFQSVKGRSRALRGVSHGSEFDLIDDTYNANPDSVRAAIEVLAGLPGPRLLVLGDMGEVGLNGPQFHAEAGAYARTAGIEALFTLGELSKVTSEAFGPSSKGVHWESMDALKKGVLDALPAYRSVLVKGSRFMKMESVVEAVMSVAQDSQVAQALVTSASARASAEAPCS